MRIALARAVSILGHPLVLLTGAALIAANSQGASVSAVRSIAFVVATVDLAVLSYSLWKVRSDQWGHIDAIERSERRSLNVFPGALLFMGGIVLWPLYPAYPTVGFPNRFGSNTRISDIASGGGW